MALQKIVGKQAKKIGVAPSIILINPKFAHNVGSVQRAASCWGFKQVWFTGNRVSLDGGGERLPREERMKGYADVDVFQYDYPFDMLPDNCTPVAVEVRENSESLEDFVHPENPVYVFGPEDGGLNRVVLQHCHRFLTIPTRHCLNLACAVNVVMWDRVYKHCLKTGELPDGLGLREHRGLVGSNETAL